MTVIMLQCDAAGKVCQFRHEAPMLSAAPWVIACLARRGEKYRARKLAGCFGIPGFVESSPRAGGSQVHTSQDTENQTNLVSCDHRYSNDCALPKQDQLGRTLSTRPLRWRP